MTPRPTSAPDRPTAARLASRSPGPQPLIDGHGSSAGALRWLPAVLRAAILAVIAAALFLPGIWRPHGATARTLRIRSAADLRSSDALLGDPAPVAIAYEGKGAPGAPELDALAAAAERTPLFVAAPACVRLVGATAPAHALAGRAAAVAFHVRGPAGQRVRVRLDEAGATVDTLSLDVGRDGEAAGAFRVRPAAPGWREWSVRATWPHGDSAVATTGAWVDSAGAPRVLVRAGLPDWESKFVTRALEESGATVDESLSLGRGLAVAQGGGSAITPDRLARTDAVLVLDGAPLSPGEAAALAEWASRGGGVLLAGDRAGAPGFGLVRPRESVAAVDGATVRWSAPAEIAPLPADRVSAAAQPLGAAMPGTSIAASAPGGGVLALRPLGQGRAGALALTETWRWRMEAGRVAEHREFWRSLVDWLSSARTAPLSIDIPGAIGPVGVRRQVRVYDRRPDGATVAPALVVTRPRGADTLRLVRDPSSPGVWRGWFVAAAPGLHTFAIAGQPTGAAFHAVADAPVEADAWARVSFIASRSGGEIIAPDSLPRLLSRAAPAGPGHGPSAIALFLAVLLLASAEWSIRRLTGRA